MDRGREEKRERENETFGRFLEWLLQGSQRRKKIGYRYESFFLVSSSRLYMGKLGESMCVYVLVTGIKCKRKDTYKQTHTHTHPRVLSRKVCWRTGKIYQNQERGENQKKEKGGRRKSIWKSFFFTTTVVGSACLVANRRVLCMLSAALCVMSTKLYFISQVVLLGK